MIKLCLMIIILYTNCCEAKKDTNTTTRIAKLDYWSPDPKFNLRRLVDNPNSIRDKPNEDKKKVSNRVRFTTRIKVQNSSEIKRDRKMRSRLYSEHNRGSIKHMKKIELHNHHNRSEEVESWPKTKRVKNIIRSKGNNGKFYYSTRLIPMYLMQQPQGSTTTHPKTTNSTEYEKLSAYSIEKQMQRIFSELPEVNVSMEVVGRTVEYNDLLLIKMSEHKTDKYFRVEENKYVEDVPEKKIIFIVHGLSVNGMQALNILSMDNYVKKLLSYYIAHLDKYDIFLMPMANPDGYTIALKTYWNKNMSPQSACPGVSLDRNFDVAWGTGKMYNSCSQLYPGPTPFSETETRAVREVFHQYGHKIVAYIHAHPGTPNTDVFKGEGVLYPKGYTDVQSDDDKYIDLRGEIDEAMKNASFQLMTVTVDTLHSWYGKVTGTSVDYASTVYGIPYAFEFAMQVYENDSLASESDEKTDYNALTEIWRRVINVIFNSIWKNLNSNDANYKH